MTSLIGERSLWTRDGIPVFPNLNFWLIHGRVRTIRHLRRFFTCTDSSASTIPTHVPDTSMD